MNYYFLDTSAVLNGAYKKFNNVWISPIVLMELENIKTSQKDEQVKYLARQAVRDIISATDIHFITTNTHARWKFRKYPILQDIHDHWLIAEAAALKTHNNEVHFVTSDGAQYLIAKQVKELDTLYYGDITTPVESEEYSGWGKYYPNDEELAMLYSDPKINILKCKTNEFAKIYVGNELKDVLFWTGTEYRKLKYKEFVAPTGERIVPRNIEQKMYLDLLQNDSVPIKLCIGRFGTGKSMFAETWATHQVVSGVFDKIVFVKNNLEVKGAGKLGTLPGDEIDKQFPWLRQLEDHLGPQLFEEYLNDGRIEPAHLSTLRGRDLKHSLILVDEAENLLTTNIQLLLGRVAEGSQIIFCADVKQCDYKDEKSSGIPRLISRLAGDELFGMVRLIKTERSAIAAKADLLD